MPQSTPETIDQPPARRDPADGWRHIPAAIIALGCPIVADDRLMSLQAAVGRAIAWIASIRLPRRPARAGATRALAGR